MGREKKNVPSELREEVRFTRFEVRRGAEIVDTFRNSLVSVRRGPLLLYPLGIAIGSGVPNESIIRFAFYEYEKPFVWLSLVCHANLSPSRFCPPCDALTRLLLIPLRGYASGTPRSCFKPLRDPEKYFSAL